MENTFLERLEIYFIVMIFIVLLFELGLLIFSIFAADEVECNLLWCSFKTTTSTTSYSEECFVNGEKVNCSSLDWDEGDLTRQLVAEPIAEPEFLYSDSFYCYSAPSEPKCDKIILKNGTEIILYPCLHNLNMVIKCINRSEIKDIING